MNPRDAFDTFKTFPRIETSRLVLREIKPSDAKDLFSFMSDEETLKNNLMIPHSKIAETYKLIETLKKQYKKKRELRWGTTLKGSDIIIGTIGYFNFYPQDFQAEIGVILAKQHWQGGIMTEALTAALNFGFEKMAFHRITIFILPANVAAIKLATKVGFRQEGLLKECKFLNGRFYDLGVYALLKKDFLKS
jgi:ribosomal-protein-alanine N-acetyltransferase